MRTPLFFLFLLCTFILKGQTIKPKRGYTPQVGATVSMMEDLKRRVTNSVANLSPEEADFLFDDEANRIGALILHLVATEKYYQVYTFENRGFNQAEKEQWGMALELGKKAQVEIQGQPIDYYLDIWNDVRKETLRLLKTRDDDWFASKVAGSNMNNHWAWYHVMEHQANHMGQIRFILKRME